MFNLSRPEQKPVVLIRTVACYCLTDEEKQKLIDIEDNAQENKIEVIKLNNIPLTVESKAVNIELGSLAEKDKIEPEDFSEESIFIIACDYDITSLDE